MNPVEQIYEAAGMPDVDNEGAQGVCRIIGKEGAGNRFNKWVSSKFTDWPYLYPGDIISVPALFCFAEQSQLLASKVGREKPQRMRTYSHFVLNGEWTAWDKGQKTEMLELLRSGPEVAVISDSGQKHFIFKAQPGVWCYEGLNIRPDSDKLEEYLYYMQKAYNAGVSKKAIEMGMNQWHLKQLFDCYDDAVEIYEKLHQWHGDPMYDLSLFLLQKTEQPAKQQNHEQPTGPIQGSLFD